jgi:hypothetical protein
MQNCNAVSIVSHACAKDGKAEAMMPHWDSVNNMMVAVDGYRIAIAKMDIDLPPFMNYQTFIPKASTWSASLSVSSLLEAMDALSRVGHGVVKVFSAIGHIDLEAETSDGKPVRLSLEAELIQGSASPEEKIALNASYVVDFCKSVAKMEKATKNSDWGLCEMSVLNMQQPVKFTAGPKGEYMELIMPTVIQWRLPGMN